MARQGRALPCLCPVCGRPLFWILVAVMVFWALGAYNRLVRLRAAAQAADTQWQEVLRRWVQMSQAWRAAAPVQAADLADGAALAANERLEHASQVLEAALVAAQARGGERLPSHTEWDACRALAGGWTDMLANAGGTEGAEMAPWRAQAADLQAVTTIAARAMRRTPCRHTKRPLASSPPACWRRFVALVQGSGASCATGELTALFLKLLHTAAC